MEPDAAGLFLDFSIRKLEQLLGRIRECVGKLDSEQIWARSGDRDNAVGNLLLHLSGNVRQWIIAGIGGQPDERVRDREFAARGEIEPGELIRRLGVTVAEAVTVLKALSPARLTESYKPQDYQVTILEGIYHVVEHFAEHTGQIIFATKLLTGQDLGFYKHLSRPAHTEKTP
jgi:uncharacterized damage-inducible protein DinB